MSWKASSVMDERMRFVLEQERGLHTMTELCEIYDIARETGYYWLRRYQQGGLEALQDLNRAPERHPNQTPEQIEAAVLELRRAHMRWGPRKLKRVLQREAPQKPWPAASTIGAMLAREGLVIPRKKRRRAPPYTQPFGAADAPNRVWCADFKGWFQTQDGQRVDPLTITDAHSRYLLRCQRVAKTNGEHVQAVFEAAFREYGLPQAMRTDNGAPFASRAIAGLSRLAVWWMKLGIVPERIAAGHPEQNGRHERMHRTMKQETASPPKANPHAQQQAFHRFRREYNEERPHEALGMQTPSAVYRPSLRPYPLRVPEPEYGSALQVRRVDRSGVFSWKGDVVFLSETLMGEPIGLLPQDDRFYTVYFISSPIARFDSYRRRILALPAVLAPAGAGEGEASPSPAPHQPVATQAKVSGMCPV
ncbi:MAG TPA: IS481 family transposase [Candidatus Acidoferrum sp.]|jgi:transposase InsO family protein|nr:IS481 family transposase [Candidatus Acidoferrum sp.]